ncbi:5-oxoprolinase [Acuticoccus sediminis]|uniref:5-oxoprolinase n=1 Tax=Acuticoccus sediminis TaxID=2184697 RepID=A0A8B2NY57_9HYPH|nr:hydantoinase B/oxoprolinase family protein [Acuticoccus sediminis]RAI02484.1 5-oxoprolinase [Acuticoccus sediminis]
MDIAPTPSDEIDPITLEVVRNKLDGIANEMEWTLLTSSFSPIVKEGMDASASLFTVDGTTLSQASAIPAHLTMLIPCVENMLKEFPLATMREGDLYCMNDPYAGGTHIPDIAVLMPVFHNGRPIALSAAMTHHQDIGGSAPGSIPTNATELYQEGLVIPALPLVQGGKYNETLIKMMRLNTRIPDTLIGDLNAQIAACRVGAKRMTALADTTGANELSAIFDTLLNRSEALTRAALRTLPPGTYHSVDYLDNDGVELDKRVRVEVAVTIGDGTLHVDFTGTSPQVRGPFNVVPSGSMAAVNYAVRALTDATIPTNGGCFRPVTMNLPEGSLVNPRHPAPVNARSAVIKLIANNIIHALAEAVPDRVTAFNANQHILMFGGIDAGGKPFVVGEGVCGGTGAHSHGDGLDSFDSDTTNGMNLPVEAIEMDFPLLMRRSELRRDSGGPGQYRGGLGLLREYVALQDDITFTHRAEHHYSDPRGIAGGGNAMRARTIITRADGREEIVPSKTVTRLNTGDAVLIQTPGGGGWGPVARRDPAALARDVDDRKVSADAAAQDWAPA